MSRERSSFLSSGEKTWEVCLILKKWLATVITDIPLSLLNYWSLVWPSLTYVYVIVHIIIKTRTCTHSPVRLREVCLYFSILSLHVNQYSDPEHVACSESHVKSSDPKTHARTRRCDLFCLLKGFPRLSWVMLWEQMSLFVGRVVVSFSKCTFLLFSF